MGTLDIPLVEPETTIQDVLDQMTLVDRCGVVVQRPGASELLYVRQVLEARDEGLAEVGQIQDGVPILDANGAGVGAAALDLVEPQRTWLAYENLFHSYPRQHFVPEHFMASLRPRSAIVATAHAAEGRSLGTLAGYIGPAGLDLPLMEPEIEIDDALVRMSSLQRSAVVVEDGNAGILMPESALRQSRGLGIRLLAVSGGLPVPFLSYRETAASGLSLAGPRRLDSFFGRYPQHLVLAAPVPRTVTLVTSRESLAFTLSGSKYSCNGRTRPYGRPHYFPNPSVNDGDHCPKWPACNVDGTRTIVSRII